MSAGAELAGALAQLDECAPWFAPHAPALVSCRDVLARGQGVAEALNHLPEPSPSGLWPRFAAPDAAPDGEAYEAFIARTGTVPTRDNLHDLFNGLCWRQFPHTKRRINQLQAACIARDGVQAVRGPVRDALTLLDENGALLQAPAPLWEALLARDWHRAFVGLRPLWAQARLSLLGHALLEKLARPRKDLTAHVYLARGDAHPAPDLAPPALDAWLAAELDAGWLAAKPFTPLPVLGVPGWWRENANFSFYDDSHVFRPRRTTQPPKI